MNFTGPDDFKFIDGDLNFIEIDNDIMPVRLDKSKIRGMDVAFLLEALEERRNIAGLDSLGIEFSAGLSIEQIALIDDMLTELSDLKEEDTEGNDPVVKFVNGALPTTDKVLNGWGASPHFIAGFLTAQEQEKMVDADYVSKSVFEELYSSDIEDLFDGLKAFNKAHFKIVNDVGDFNPLYDDECLFERGTYTREQILSEISSTVKAPYGKSLMYASLVRGYRETSACYCESTLNNFSFEFNGPEHSTSNIYFSFLCDYYPHTGDRIQKRILKKVGSGKDVIVTNDDMEDLISSVKSYFPNNMAFTDIGSPDISGYVQSALIVLQGVYVITEDDGHTTWNS